MPIAGTRSRSTVFSIQVSSGPLHTVADGLNGVYSGTLGSFPDQSYQSSNYFVDVVVAP